MRHLVTDPNQGFDSYSPTPEDWTDYEKYLDETNSHKSASQEFDDYLDFLAFQQENEQQYPVFIHASEMTQPTPWSE